MDKVNKIKQEIFYQVNIYLKELGEFSPFGVKMIGDEIKSVSYYYENKNDDETEELDSNLMISVISENISKAIKKGEVELGAIAYSVLIKDYKHQNEVMEKIDALCIKYTLDGDNWKEEFYPYRLKDGKYVWGL
ncbi:hypothetical protein NHF50_03485 [Flavobacterium sp. NRK F10]|uniref:hypothetical protein n=1 Tax=Flavobacterium sp. NRK F10 TaxID=2954931 RepID=UPI0020904E91|nr:hypothetical protein [Flavobacterium sp. NRK F10]MCO6174099.1 hypothetical protein [Flavobacterium sp. NRK F10]